MSSSCGLFVIISAKIGNNGDLVHLVLLASTRRDLSHSLIMSEPQTSSPAPRRSQRDRKTVKPFESGKPCFNDNRDVNLVHLLPATNTPATRKRKRNERDAEDDTNATGEQE